VASQSLRDNALIVREISTFERCGGLGSGAVSGGGCAVGGGTLRQRCPAGTLGASTANSSAQNQMTR
jgi:hypothetical protein